MCGMAEDTEIGGPRQAFLTTPWTEIVGVKGLSPGERRKRLGFLIDRYWKPVYFFIRRSGKSNEEAKDLTQEFFRRFILEDKLVQAADRELGSFRQLLTTALKRFVSSYQRDRTRKKRTPEGGIIPLPSAELIGAKGPISEATPEDALYYAWVTNLLDQTLAETKRQCCDAGMAKHWQVFHSKVLAPILEGNDDLSLKEICHRYGVESEAKASNMLVTVRRCFKRTLKRRLRDLARSDSQAEAEFREILAFLS